MIDQLHALAEAAGFECIGQAPATALQEIGRAHV